MINHKNKSLQRVFYARLLIFCAIILSFYWLTSTTTTQPLITVKPLLFLWLTLLSIQTLAFRFRLKKLYNLLIQILSDLILIGFIIYSSSGYASPFTFLLGLVIILAGAQASALLALTTSVLASGTYIFSVYIYANNNLQPIPVDQALKLLLQTSLFFLAGGIMALIARRHATLEQKQKDLSLIHI